jgi:hypothetical protein
VTSSRLIFHPEVLLHSNWSTLLSIFATSDTSPSPLSIARCLYGSWYTSHYRTVSSADAIRIVMMTSRTAYAADCSRSSLMIDVKSAAVDAFELPPQVTGNGNPFPENDGEPTTDVLMMQKYYALWDSERHVSTRTGNGSHRQPSDGAMTSFPVATEIRRDGSYGYVCPPPSSTSPHKIPSYGHVSQSPPSPPLSAMRPSTNSTPEMQPFSRCAPGYLADFGSYGYAPCSDVCLDAVATGGPSVYAYRRGQQATDDDNKPLPFPGTAMRYDGSNGGSAADLYQWVRDQQNISLAGMSHRPQTHQSGIYTNS